MIDLDGALDRRSSFCKSESAPSHTYQLFFECLDKRIAKSSLHELQRGLFSVKTLQKGKQINYLRGKLLLLTHQAVEALRLLEAGSALVDGERIPDDIMVSSRRVISQMTIPISTESMSCQG